MTPPLRPCAAQYRAARAWADWTIQRAARRCGLSESTIRKLEYGDASVSEASAERLAAAYRAAGFVFATAALGRPRAQPTT